ncbi:MAG: hemerythrin domain-containing protein [Persicimonas sp.]
MTQQASVHEQMSHGHTRLIWLLDDIQAHLEGLCEGTDEPELILEELVSYVRAFSEELDGHIEEEETDVFPRAEAVGGGDGRQELAELEAEHRSLQAQMKAFWTILSDACEISGEGNGTCFDDLLDRVGAIRKELAAHSSHERAFLTQAEHQLRESSPG